MCSLSQSVEHLAKINSVYSIPLNRCCINHKLIFRAVKLSSPNLNYVIIAGSMLMYISIFIYLLPYSEESIVLARCIVS